MELASMLAGERFSDRPKSVCPLIGAVLRTYNDSLDDRRRQDLYRFAAEVVGTRGDFDLQHERAEIALAEAREARSTRTRRWTLRRPPRRPEADAGPEEISDYVVESIARRAYSRYRSRRWDDDSHARMVELLDRLIATGGAGAFDALLGEMLEHPGEAVEHGGGDDELFIGELGHRSPEEWLEAGAPLFDELTPPFGEGGEDYAAVAVGAGALHEAVFDEAVEHLGDAGWPQVGGYGEISAGELVAVAQAEEQAELSVAQFARAPVPFAATQAPDRSHRTLERSAQVLGGLALLALTCHVRRYGR